MRAASLLLAFLVSVAAPAAERPALRFVTPLGVDLRSLHLDDTQSRFGTAQRTSGGHREQVCYLWPNALATFSSADGFWMAFELSEVPKQVPPECVKVKAADANEPLIVEGLHLGMNEQEFSSTIGERAESKDGKLVVQFQWTEILKNLPPEGRGVSESTTEVRIEGGFSNHRLTTLFILYGTSL